MKWLIDPDSPFYKIMNFFADMVMWGFLYFLCAWPIFTIGAANCAIYSITKKINADEKAGIKDFINAFKKNFLSNTFIWLAILFLITTITFLLYVNMYLFLPIAFFCVLEIIFFFVYFFPLTSKNKFPLAKSIKLSFLLAHKHLFTTVLCAAILAITLITCFFYPPLFLICAGVYNFLTCNLLEKIFAKYNL